MSLDQLKNASEDSTARSGRSRRPRNKRLRVAVVTPLSSSGGVSSLMALVGEGISGTDVDLRFLDTRGRYRRPVFSIFPLVRTCAALVAVALTRRVDVVHVNISLRGSTLRKIIVVGVCRAFRLPVVLHLHGGSYAEFLRGMPPLGRTIIMSAFRAASVVLVLGDGWRRYVCSDLGVPADRVVVLPNAARGPHEVTPKDRDEDRPLEILFLGRLGAGKGVPELLAALASPALRDEPWIATLAGDGDVDSFRRQAISLGLGDRVSFPGWVGREEATALLRNTHLLVLPSHAEGLPMSVLEAFAHAVPVVTTHVGALSEVVQDGVQGLVVAPGDEEALARAIAAFLHDEPNRRALGLNARRTWESRFALEPYITRLIAVWRAVAR